MTSLAHTALMDLSLTVDFAAIRSVGETPAGLRRIVPVTGGHFTGARLSGTVLPGGADWVINRPDGVMVIDVRLMLETADKALIYLTYQGRFLAEPEIMQRFAKGTLLDPADYSLAIIARFECGAPHHAWLNNAIVVGTGVQTRTGPIYSLFTVG